MRLSGAALVPSVMPVGNHSSMWRQREREEREAACRSFHFINQEERRQEHDGSSWYHLSSVNRLPEG
ncbi:hypothetical protein EYF80_055965 [Liparis tanakae]|uniref:Uncharacterized protein n=1 Tax=Liparis tanakae TaxID=230148 RepID=A0A4Z2F056_9TELE|nr:hypothetical protein EYF80_055965 [Liparis tanakae]